MRSRNTRRGAAAAAVLLSAGLVLAGCGGDDDEGGSAGGTSPGEGKAECKDLTQFGDLSGKEVSLYTSIVAPEDKPYKDSFKLFEDCTGASVAYEGSKEFEAQLVVRVKSGNPPDVAFIPQPGLLQTLVKDTGKVVEAPQSVSDNVDEFYGEDWKKYGTVDGTFYAPPLTANVKSFVWYSPKMFQENGWDIPTTWDDMLALSDKIAATGIKPWCAGIESGEATGWPATDWLEDVLLRTAGADVYDQWVAHEIPFNDPAVVEGLDTVGNILKNDKYVNGGIGDVKSIATEPFQEAGYPIADGECAMHRQASFYAANWKEKDPNLEIGEDKDVFAFYLPPIGEEFGNPVLGGGEFVAAFSDAPEVQAFQTYISGGEWVNEKGKATPNGGFVSANKNLDIANVASPIDKLSTEILQDPDATFRFDGSDLMPGAVGAGSFWKEMTAWIAEDQSTQDTLDNIESSWP
ncbi:extracellular solute-binding protein [Nocardioides sp. MAH-18]|uniref:Extracellular solute-binding protein n=1 Tax=Nocardioides agri TaxID=2682843 RepID=A0A6L6XQ03_9ACTN|nr:MULTISPECIES: ABC transporter substrate-binding protein [unclassified Nocardioides]MBA2954359.1 carbohydrate ABC transporter substrate-binding protein [Nocardioides sp. CGMCC 1.13656]MVQ49220.1 extracellular solute-binding protein [Nocardioides sp. MAH-18]